MKSLRIATLQGKWFKTTEATNAWYVSEAKKLKDSKLDILVLPELYHTPYFPIEEGEKGFDWAIEKNDALVSEWQTIAKELNAVVVFPFFEKRARGIYYNSAYVFERDGSIAGLYRKSHIPDDPGFYEKYYFAPGDTGFEPIQTSAGKIGVLICWDQWFPEAARCMALMGAQLLFYPTAIGSEPIIECDSMPHWRRCMQGHSAANVIPVIAANRIGEEKVLPSKDNNNQSSTLVFYGSSFITDETGELIETANRDEETIILHTFDLDDIEEMRMSWGLFRDRRPEMYRKITE